MFDETARAGPPGVRLHRGARALHRALDVGDVLGEVPGALAGAGRDGRVRRARRTCSSCAATRSPRRSTTASPAGRSGSRPRGADYWRPIIARRREIYTALQAWEPPPALGPPPHEVNEPFTVMLWGITTSTVGGVAARRRRGRRAARHRRARPASSRARSAWSRTSSELRVVRARATSSSARPRRRRGRRCSPAIAATVSDVGGIMSHTAIVCREYGHAGRRRHRATRCSTLRTGQRVRVDGERRRGDGAGAGVTSCWLHRRATGRRPPAPVDAVRSAASPGAAPHARRRPAPCCSTWAAS